MVEHGQIQVVALLALVDLVVLVVVHFMEDQYNHLQVILSLPQMPLLILHQMDGDIQVVVVILVLLEILEVVVVLEVLVKLLI